ncbi:unnamed protein product [Cunninghamella blakesleeana]
MDWGKSATKSKNKNKKPSTYLKGYKTDLEKIKKCKPLHDSHISFVSRLLNDQTQNDTEENKTIINIQGNTINSSSFGNFVAFTYFNRETCNNSCKFSNVKSKINQHNENDSIRDDTIITNSKWFGLSTIDGSRKKVSNACKHFCEIMLKFKVGETVVRMNG